MAGALDSSIRNITLTSDSYRPVIAAIDFGTSSSGYAYVIRHHENETLEPRDIKLNKWQIGTASSFTDKAPTTVLFKPDETFDCFGYKAEDKYARLCATNKEKGWWYFEKFKMALYNTKKLSRETTITDAEDKKMYAIRVFSAVIAHLKEHILHDVKMQIGNITDDEILYVLTVPAIWSDAAKQFMREAATSEEVGIKTEQLSLVLEPEAASVYCRETPTSAVKTTSGRVRLTSLPEGHKYVIVDLGGGTADIATHEIMKNGCLHEVLNARGDNLGGQQFNERFLDFFTRIFGKEIFDSWRKKKTGHFLKMQRCIEGYKWGLSNSEEDVLFEIPQSLSEVVCKTSGKSIEEVIQNNSSAESIDMCGSGEILISNKTVKSFFRKIIDGIQGHLDDVVKKAPGLQTIFLVGGMAKSAFIRDYIKQYFQNVTLTVPEDPGVAVLKGAVLLGNRPQTIAGRVARFSYGIDVSENFEEGKHREDYKFTRDGRVKCSNVFWKLIEKGQVLKYGDRFTTNTHIDAILPETKQKTYVTYLYQSTKPSPTYCTEEGCTKLGGFEKYPPEGGWPDFCKERVEIVVGEAEFKLCVKDDIGREYETKGDFL